MDRDRHTATITAMDPRLDERRGDRQIGGEAEHPFRVDCVSPAEVGGREARGLPVTHGQPELPGPLVARRTLGPGRDDVS
jgi:hypothetical protein